MSNIILFFPEEGCTVYCAYPKFIVPLGFRMHFCVKIFETPDYRSYLKFLNGPVFLSDN